MIKTIFLIGCIVAAGIYWKDLSPIILKGYQKVDTVMLSIHKTLSSTEETVDKVKSQLDKLPSSSD